MLAEWQIHDQLQQQTAALQDPRGIPRQKKYCSYSTTPEAATSLQHYHRYYQHQPYVWIARKERRKIVSFLIYLQKQNESKINKK